MKFKGSLLLLPLTLVLSVAVSNLMLLLFPPFFAMDARVMFVVLQIAEIPKTCPANREVKCDGDGWEGEFFPGISKIKYEVIFHNQMLRFH